MSSSSFQGLTWPDYMVIMVYFVFIIMVGFIVSRAEIIYGKLNEKPSKLNFQVFLEGQEPKLPGGVLPLV